MSVILEADEHTPRASGDHTPLASGEHSARASGEHSPLHSPQQSSGQRTPLASGERPPHEPETQSNAGEQAGERDVHEVTSQRSTSRKSGQSTEQIEEAVTREDHAKDDTGGGGDTEGSNEIKQGDHEEEHGGSPLRAGSKGDSASTIGEKKSKSDNGSASRASESKKSIQKEGSQLTVKSAGTLGESSSESLSSGFRIATQILEDLIDTVIQIKEAEEAEKKSQQDEGMKQSSITTIKSEDDKGSLEIDPELQAQLALEEEAAALERQQKYQENIALYHTLLETRTNLKRRNAFLLKQMYEHYKKKKIEHLFKDIPVAHVDMEGKYIRALLAYEEAHKLAMEEEIKVAETVTATEEKQQAIQLDLEEDYNNLINREREVAKGISATVTAKHLSAKELEILIQRQVSKSKEVAKERLKYFKLRDKAAADESHLKSLENLGGNYTLMEYEQLKMKSQSCVVKLEERDAELHRLRCKATSVIQVLSEIREKTHVLQEDIETGKVTLHDVNQHLIQTRERVGYEKKRRDMSRSDAVRLRQEAGLLSEPKLFQDYKESLTLKENLLEQLEDCKSKFESQKQHILSLRRELAALQQKGDKTD